MAGGLLGHSAPAGEHCLESGADLSTVLMAGCGQ